MNGIVFCLNHHRAFDGGLFQIDPRALQPFQGCGIGVLLPARGRCACGARTQGWVLRRLQRRDGGEACIVRTRIPVWLLVQARHLGTSEADLLRAYPTLRAEDLANAWAYARAHADEIERQIRENEAA